MDSVSLKMGFRIRAVIYVPNQHGNLPNQIFLNAGQTNSDGVGALVFCWRFEKLAGRWRAPQSRSFDPVGVAWWRNLFLQLVCYGNAI